MGKLKNKLNGEPPLLVEMVCSKHGNTRHAIQSREIVYHPEPQTDSEQKSGVQRGEWYVTAFVLCTKCGAKGKIPITHVFTLTQWERARFFRNPKKP